MAVRTGNFGAWIAGWLRTDRWRGGWHRLRDWLRGRSLRSRLVGLLLGLVTLALLLSGLAATTALQSYLVNQVDNRTVAMARDLADPRFPGRGENHSGGPGGGPSLSGTTYVQVNEADGTLRSATAADSETVPALPTWTLTQVNELGEVPITVGSVAGATRWRVAVSPLADGTGYSVAATSIAAIDATVAQLMVLQLIIGLLVLTALGVLAHFVVRRSLTGLVAVEETAAQVASGNLAVRAPVSDPRTEVGSLAESFNIMVGNLQSAFQAQASSEAAARSSADSARQSEARMRQFVADASHELRTPLTSIRGYSELYRIGAVGPGEALTSAMARIEDEASRMGLLVDDLLLLARLDQQRPLESNDVDLVDLSVAAVTSARVAAPMRDIALEVAASPEVAVIKGDAARLRQVLDNLLANAVRYTPAPQPIVVRVGPTKQGWTQVSVIDHGPGLAPDVAARVFERFYREDKARSRAAGGSGLGLAIAAAIVKAHGGRIELATAPGQGAIFRVVLPVLAAAATAPA